MNLGDRIVHNTKPKKKTFEKRITNKKTFEKRITKKKTFEKRIYGRASKEMTYQNKVLAHSEHATA